MQIPPGRLTNILLGLTVGAWLILTIAGMEDYAFIAGGFIPARISDLVTVADAVPAWLTPVSSALLHSGFMHIAFNSLMLLFCGRFVEYALGPKLMLGLYVAGAYAASLAQYAVDPSSPVPVIGASGAISALVGAYALLFSRQKVRSVLGLPPVVVHVLWLATAWIGLQLLVGVGFGSGGDMAIAIWAHIGGFIAGLVLAVPLVRWRHKQEKARQSLG